MKCLYVLIVIVCVISSNSIATVNNGVHKLSSVHRRNSQKASGDCFLLKVGQDQRGKPTNLMFTGHCCDNMKKTDIKVVVNATKRGLEATFQWWYDTDYYLTAKRIGNPFQFKRINKKQVSDDQRFILSNPQSQCPHCVAMKSASTQLYLATTGTGRLVTTTNYTDTRAWFVLYTCKPAVMKICNSTIVC